MTNTVTGEVAADLTRKAMEQPKHCRDAETNEELEVQAKEPRIAWLADEYGTRSSGAGPARTRS